MKLRLATACALATLSLAGAAFAEGRVTATLEQPTAAKTKFIVSHSVFVCLGDTCSSPVADDSASSVLGCKALAAKVGRLSAYSTERRDFDAVALANCNTAAPVTATASR